MRTSPSPLHCKTEPWHYPMLCWAHLEVEVLLEEADEVKDDRHLPAVVQLLRLSCHLLLTHASC